MFFFVATTVLDEDLLMSCAVLGLTGNGTDWLWKSTRLDQNIDCSGSSQRELNWVKLSSVMGG